MRLSHGSHVSALFAALLLSLPVAAARHHPDEKKKAQPPRIVSTYLCADEYVYRLVPRNRIAGLSYLAGATEPIVSTIADRVQGIPLVHASADEVLALKPTMVVTYRNTNSRLKQQLERAHVSILEVPWAQSLADVRRITQMVGTRLGAKDRANALVAEMDARLVSARLQAPRPPVTTLVYQTNGSAMQGGVADEILAAAGLRNLADALNPMPSGTLPVEAVVAARPELLILDSKAKRSRSGAVAGPPALAALKGKSLIAHAPLSPLLCPGPWSADVAGAFALLGQKARSLTHERSGE